MRALPWIVLWAATVAAAWHLGRTSPEGPLAPRDGEEQAPASASWSPGAGPSLSAGPGRPRSTGPSRGTGAASERLRGPAVAQVPSDAPLSLEGVRTADDLLARLFAFAAAQLAQGPQGHRALYRALDGLLAKDQPLERLLASEERLAPHLYPLARFLMERDEQLVDMLETLLATAADEPAFFEGTDDETFELFSQGLGPLLPGMLSPERLERIRGQVERVLATSAEAQPRGVRKLRSDLERLLSACMPRLASKEAAARLAAGGLAPREALALLRQVAPEDRGSLDLVELLGPLVESGDARAFTADLFQGLDARDRSRLDQRLLAAPGLRLTDWHLRTWLEATGRSSWEAAGDFLTQALQRGAPLADQAALTLLHLRPRPSAEVVDGLLKRHALDPRVVEHLRSGFGLK